MVMHAKRDLTIPTMNNEGISSRRFGSDKTKCLNKSSMVLADKSQKTKAIKTKAE